MAIIGIDLGTTNSLVCAWKDGQSVLIPNSLGKTVTPSVVGIDEDGKILVGEIAKERLISHPQKTVASFKLFMGTQKKYNLGKQKFTPIELSAILLRRLKEDAEQYLGEEVTEAIISVPAYFNENQRLSTKQAGALAGLHVDRLVNEPSAAALACRIQQPQEDICVMVVDLGGGTLDVSIVDCFDDVVEILSVSGDNHLGGNDFDQLIAEYFCVQNGWRMEDLSPETKSILLKRAEQCKQALSHSHTSMIVIQDGDRAATLSLTNEKLIELLVRLLEQMKKAIIQALRDSSRQLSDIDQIVMVGGSCNMPIIQQYIYHLFHKETAQLGAPESVVVKGIGIYTGIKMRNNDVRDMLLTDICPFTLGVDVSNFVDLRNLMVVPIIERNSTLPTSKVHQFHASGTIAVLGIYQGESLYAKDNIKLGEMTVSLFTTKAKEVPIDVRFTYDINGILEVEVQNQETKDIQKKVIVSAAGAMSSREIKTKLAQLDHLKMHPKDEEENRLLVAKAERLYTETTQVLRYNIGQALQRFQYFLFRQERYEIQREREKFAQYLDEIEDQQLTFMGEW